MSKCKFRIGDEYLKYKYMIIVMIATALLYILLLAQKPFIFFYERQRRKTVLRCFVVAALVQMH